jgi:hypothetical protein
MLKYLVIDAIQRKSVVVQSVRDASRIAGVRPDEIEFALDELGIRETNRYTVVEIFIPHLPHLSTTIT